MTIFSYLSLDMKPFFRYPPPMKFGHRVHGKIERYDDKGRGVFQLDGRKVEGYQEGSGTVAVPFTTVGDEVTATFLKRDHGLKIAKIETLDAPGPDRVAAPCPHAGVCGGCLWQHMKYEAQVELKKTMINRAFENAGHEERVETIIPATEQFHHRNRMDYAVGWNGEIGLKEHDSWNRYVDLKTCLLLNDGIGEILQQVREWMNTSDLQPWDAKFYTGDVRYVVIREGKATKQRVIIVVVKDAARVNAEMKSNLKHRLETFCTTLLIGEQSLQTDLSYAQTFETLFGEPWHEEIVNDVRYRIHPNSFFQTNSGMAAKLQEAVASLCHSREDGNPALSADRSEPDSRLRGNDSRRTILDLYCGLGFFGIYLAKQNPALKIHGFEIDANAIELAKFNAQQNGVGDRCDFTSGPAEDLSWKDIDADLVILDPPRAGLHPKVIKTILEKPPKEIVYVSCSYKRLVEELKQFKTKYKIEQLTALDLFPHSPHVEVVVKLVRIL
jgi:tRNA (uracil-5-)-methyltransferase